MKTRISPAGDIQLADFPACVVANVQRTAQPALLSSRIIPRRPGRHCRIRINIVWFRLPPAVRVSIGEAFGYVGKNFTKKLYALLRRLVLTRY